MADNLPKPGQPGSRFELYGETYTVHDTVHLSDVFRCTRESDGELCKIDEDDVSDYGQWL